MRTSCWSQKWVRTNSQDQTIQELGNQNTWGSTLNPNRNSNVGDNQGQLSSQNEPTPKADNQT